MPASTTKRASRSSSSRVPIVEPTTRSCLKKILVSSAFAGASPDVAPEMTTVPPGRRLLTECDHVAAPTVSMTASTRSGSRAPLSNARSAPSATACSPLAASRLVTHIRMPAAVPSWTSAVATPPAAPWTRTVAPGWTAGVREEHAVGREPGGRQARRVLPRQPLRLGHEVAARHGDDLGEGAVVDLRQEAAARVEGLVAGPAGRGDDGVDEHLVAVRVDARAVAAEHHREPVGGQADPAQRPHVVVVERGGAQPHGDPAVGHRGLGSLPDLETRQRVVGGLADGGGGEHAADPTSASARSRRARHSASRGGTTSESSRGCWGSRW